MLRCTVSWLATCGYNLATIARRMAAVSSLSKYLVNYGYAEVNPPWQVVPPKKVQRVPAVLTLEEARRRVRPRLAQ